jgi:hypothetical protein
MNFDTFWSFFSTPLKEIKSFKEIEKHIYHVSEKTLKQPC